MTYKQKGSPLHKHMVNSWEEEDVKRGRKLEKEGKKGHAEALFIDAHDSNRWRGGNDGSEPLHMSNQLSEGGDVIDETALALETPRLNKNTPAYYLLNKELARQGIV